MSVTIVSTLPQPTQTTAAENASSSDNAAAGQDFASLLQVQLAPIVPEVLPETTVQADLPAADATPGDAAALLAALGLVPPQPGHTVDNTETTDTSLPGSGKVDRSTSDSLTALQTMAGAGQSLKPEGTAESARTEPGLTGALAADDKAAKFAATAFVEASTATVIPKNVSPDTLANNLPGLMTNTPGNANNIPASREVALSVPTPIRDQSWAADFGQKIVWLAGNDKQAAQLTLNPPHMGPIEISLNLEKGNASVVFVSANADVREAIETALPRLREMFASAGIELGQTNVSAESFRQQAGSGDGNRSAAQGRSDNAILVADSAGSLPARAFAVQQGSGLVDIFA